MEDTNPVEIEFAGESYTINAGVSNMNQVIDVMVAVVTETTELGPAEVEELPIQALTELFTASVDDTIKTIREHAEHK